MSDARPMLEISGVHKTFNAGTINEKKALSGIDLVLNKGDFVTVIGGNGAGKSTLLNLITGVFPADCGKITIDGTDVTRLPEYKRAKYLGRVFQDPMTGTAADMQIEENLALASRRGKRPVIFIQPGISICQSQFDKCLNRFVTINIYNHSSKIKYNVFNHDI